MCQWSWYLLGSYRLPRSARNGCVGGTRHQSRHGTARPHALEPKFDARGAERSWQACKQEYLGQLAAAEPRALDICVADELHACGSTITALRRLGVEYLHTLSRADSAQTIWWYRSMLEILDARADWPRREMLSELRILSTDLVRGLRLSEEGL